MLLCISFQGRVSNQAKFQPVGKTGYLPPKDTCTYLGYLTHLRVNPSLHNGALRLHPYTSTETSISHQQYF